MASSKSKKSSTAQKSNKLDEMINLAKSKVGQNGDWSWSVSGLGRGQPWCAAFVDACAKTVGLSGSVYASSYGAGAIAQMGADAGMGQILQGPARGSTPTPQKGDLILYNWRGSAGSPADGMKFRTVHHVGFVEYSADGQVHTIEGNSGGGSNYTSTVKLHTYSISYSCIVGYYRPDWSREGLVVTGGTGGGGFIGGGDLYDMVNDKEDAILREVAYLNGKEPSISSTNIKLSVINYTTALGAFFKGAIGIPGFGGGDYSGSADASALTAAERTCFEFLLQKGLNAAGAVGVIANIHHESGFRTGALSSDGYGSVGICQWTFGRKTNMINFVGPGWENNLTGQLDFLWHELTTSYSGVLNEIKAVPNTEEGARESAWVFVNKFEIPAMQYRAIRRETASTYWKKLVILI